MVINHDRKWIYVGPPKTGSTTITYLLTDGNDWYIKTPLPYARFGGIKHRGQHCMDIPAECAEYRIIASARDPYQRAVSLWWHWNCESQRPQARRPWLSFEDFLQRVADAHKEPEVGEVGMDAFFSFTIARWLKWIPRVDVFIRQEHLAEDLNGLGLAEPIEVPRKNRAPQIRMGDRTILRRQDWWSYYSPRTIELVRAWAHADFESLGYDTAFPTQGNVGVPQ